jgi:Family of unknown function (DUF6011)
MNEPTTTQIRPGIYTIVYPDGQHRTLRIKPWDKAIKPDSPSVPLIVGYLNGSDNDSDYRYVGFLREDNGVNFWKSFRAEADATRLARFSKAVFTIAADPAKAGLAYALESSCCYRCGRTLTVPTSIHNGLGPECAKKDAYIAELAARD